MNDIITLIHEENNFSFKINGVDQCNLFDNILNIEAIKIYGNNARCERWSIDTIVFGQQKMNSSGIDSFKIRCNKVGKNFWIGVQKKSKDCEWLPNEKYVWRADE